MFMELTISHWATTNDQFYHKRMNLNKTQNTIKESNKWLLFTNNVVHCIAKQSLVYNNYPKDVFLSHIIQ